ncbi:hypothetical protein TNCV_459791 [Trichonephila clavipes]|nr:hypothetical protein TNCV_459791 [Trichonephila clavipes]
MCAARQKKKIGYSCSNRTESLTARGVIFGIPDGRRRGLGLSQDKIFSNRNRELLTGAEPHYRRTSPSESSACVTRFRSAALVSWNLCHSSREPSLNPRLFPRERHTSMSHQFRFLG